MNFSKFNKNKFEKIDWGKDTKDLVFKKLGDFYSEGITKVKVCGFFFTKTERFGLQPCAILEDCILNLPTHQNDTISEILKDKEAVKAIKNGELSLKIREYNSKYNKICYDVDYVNTDENQGNSTTESSLF